LYRGVCMYVNVPEYKPAPALMKDDMEVRPWDEGVGETQRSVTHILPHTHTLSCISTYTHTHTHAHTQTQTHTHTHTYTHTHTHTQAHTQAYTQNKLTDCG